MPFRAMRMHCPGDEKIIPLYRPDDTTPDIATSTFTASDTMENLTERQVSVAAPKPDMGTNMTSEANTTTTQVSVAAPKSDRGTEMTSEEQRRLIREEKERDYWMMKDLEEGVVDWLSDTEFEEPEMNPKYDYDSYALTDIPVSDHSLSANVFQHHSATNPRFSAEISEQIPISLDLGTTKLLIRPIQAYTERGQDGRVVKASFSVRCSC